MTINCYYHQDPDDVWMVGLCLDSIVDALIESFSHRHTFNKIDSSSLKNPNVGSWDKWAYFNLMLENPENKKYIVITFWDRMSSLNPDNGWDTENIVEVITGSGVAVYGWDHIFRPLKDFTYTPFTYPVATRAIYNQIENLCNTPNSQRVTPEKPYFRGTLYGIRILLSEDDRFDVSNEWLENIEYVNALNEYSINLSLNGSGEICYRDMEVMGLGSCLIRPKLVVQHDDPLIPNHHYISIDFDHLPDENAFSDNNEYLKLQAEVIYDRYLEVKDDTDFINEVAKNGQEWYKRNVPPHKMGELAVRLINFDKLK